jgi:hypothetical protein
VRHELGELGEGCEDESLTAVSLGGAPGGVAAEKQRVEGSRARNGEKAEAWQWRE